MHLLQGCDANLFCLFKENRREARGSRRKPCREAVAGPGLFSWNYGIQDNRILEKKYNLMCVCVCLSENGVYRLPLPVIEHNYWTWIKLSLIYLLTKKVIFRGYLGHISQLTVVIHPPVWTAPSNSLNQLTQILLMADVDNLSPKDQKKCGSNESPVWPGSFPVLLMVIFHFYPHVQMFKRIPCLVGLSHLD